MNSVLSTERKKIGWLSFGILILGVANVIFVANFWYYFALVPFFLLVVYLALFSLDKLLLLVVFFAPVSLPLEKYAPSLGFNLLLPTEPIIAGILVLFIFRLLYERNFDRRVLLHPVSLAIYFNLFWIFLTSVTSSMPWVSFKFLLSRLWFLAAFYFLATQLFVYKRNIRHYVWAFMPMLLFVIGYAFVHMYQAGLFNQQAAHRSASPFFNDHTSYGCILAMILPFSIGFAVSGRGSAFTRIFTWIVCGVVAFALVLSYTRAAWISIIVAAGVFFILFFKMKFNYLVLILLIGGTFIYIDRAQLFVDLKMNKQRSSKSFVKHVESISNISTDESNMERLNRWKSAFRMFRERPVLGWGPGTYQFQYAPFQVSYDKTRISTDFGNMGNAHSEYIGPLAESGVLGCLSFVLIGIVTLYSGIRLYLRARGHRQLRILLLSATLGLITYYVHGALNDFLDTDKASALFWGYTAMIVSLDIYHVRKMERPA